MEVVELNSIVTEAEKTVFRLVGEDISIVTHLAGQALLVEADKRQLGQALLNLIVNVHDAMPPGGSITITTRVTQPGAADATAAGIPADKPSVCLSVQDSGTDIDEAAKQHLLESFSTTKPLRKGTGPGLSAVHRIVSSCGGKIMVDTIPGAGATFHIYLPLAGATPAATAAPEEPETRGAETILLAEDEPEVRHYVSAVLSHFKYRVVECPGAEEALEVLKTQRVDLLLTDVIMPQMSGRELVLRAKKLHPKLRVLFMSGYPGDALEGLDGIIGTRAFIQKPFSPKDLAGRVRELLSVRGGA